MSTVIPKTDTEIDAMREAGRLAAEVLEMIGDLPHADVRLGAERSFEATPSS